MAYYDGMEDKLLSSTIKKEEYKNIHEVVEGDIIYASKLEKIVRFIELGR